MQTEFRETEKKQETRKLNNNNQQDQQKNKKRSRMQPAMIGSSDAAAQAAKRTLDRRAAQKQQRAPRKKEKNDRMFTGTSSSDVPFVMPKTSPKSLKVVFLGGIGEIGKNLTALEYGDDIIIIDCGSSFPTNDMPGIDLVIPDTTYLMENKHKVRGIFITHGHEDHIGAVPYVLRQMNVPLYASDITLAVLEHKLEEHNLNEQADVRKITNGSVVRAGCFQVEFVKVSHSIAGAFALSILTPIGVVFHSGDFKVDFTPIDGEIMDLHRIAEIGKKGVHLLLCESTNVERPGYSISESAVGRSLDKIVQDNKDQRIFIATFASNIHRLQQILDLAEKNGRKVAFSGRSMFTICDAASKIGALKYNPNLIVDVDKIEKLKMRNVIVLTTGAQGEPMSALTRMASGDFNKVTIGAGDTIIISASPIPGNEKMVYNVINNLYRKGAQVIYESLAEVHASGHACQEEIKLMHALLRPKYFIPVHGEYRHLKKHIDLARSMGMDESKMLISEIGMVVEVDRKGMRVAGSIPAGNVFVDGSGIGDVGQEVLRDRKHLAEDGLLAVVVTVNPLSGEVGGRPEIASRGFVYVKESEELIETCKSLVMDSLAKFDLKNVEDWTIVKNGIRRDLSNYLFKRTRRSPMILTVIVGA